VDDRTIFFTTEFRSEVGRYFLCECKDWSRPADFSALAKFCRVLDSTKTKFGILFSKNGITGTARTTDAERELLKVFQHRGVVIIVITDADLRQVMRGGNFITILRRSTNRFGSTFHLAPRDEIVIKHQLRRMAGGGTDHERLSP
jgi:hypothetical protein